MPSCHHSTPRREEIMAKYMLVSFKTCPWVQRSAIILREKNTPFEFRHIEPDNRPDWFLAISPHKKVPTLTIDDKVTLFESNAITEYLDGSRQARKGAGEARKRSVVQRRQILASRRRLRAIPAALLLPRTDQADRSDREIQAAQALGRGADGAALDTLLPGRRVRGDVP